LRINTTIFTIQRLTKILKMSSTKCPYCPRTFSSKSGYTQHVSHCLPPLDESDDDLVTDVSNMSLDSEKFIHDIE
jgi:hypothetical protein